MGAVMHLLVPSIHAGIFSVFFTALLIVLIIYLPYRKIASVLKYLCITLLVYFIVPFFAKGDILDILSHTVIPAIQFNKEFFGILVAILGTTISPYLFFWQATMEVEEQRQKKGMIMVDKKLLREVKRDVNSGMLFSNLVMYFIILTTALVLFKNGVHTIDTIEQAARALQPLAGDFAYYLFAFGVIGTGLLAIPVLSGCLSYIISETLGWKAGLDKTFQQARSFYAVIIISLLLGLTINYLGISPIQALLYTAVLYGLTAPVMIAVIIHIANNPAIMKSFVNTRRENFLGWLTFAVMSAAAGFLIFAWAG